MKIKLHTRLALGFFALILVMIGLGAADFVMFKRADSNVVDLSAHNLPAVKQATAIERSAFEIIQEEKNYLFERSDEVYAKAGAKLKELMGQIDVMDKAAQRFNEQDLLSKSAMVRGSSAEYGQLFEKAAAALQQNRLLEQLMDEKGSKVEEEADAFMEAKKTEYLDAKNALAVANNINAWIVETRFHEKVYMLEHNQQEVKAIERNLKNLLNAYDALDKLHPDVTEKKQISNARAATQDYSKAVKTWVTEYKTDPQSESLSEFSTIMNRSGDTVSQIVDDYMLPKQGAVEKTVESVFLVRKLSGTTLSARLNEKAYIITRNPKYWEALNREMQELIKIYGALRKISVNPEDVKRIERASKATEEYLQAANTWISNDTEVHENLLPKMKENGEVVIKTAQTVENDAWAKSDQMSHLIQTVFETSKSAIILALIIGIGIGALLAWTITRSITRPINRIIDGLSSGADLLAEAAGEVSKASNQLAEGSSEQAAAIEETSSSVEEISSMTRQNADNANQANQLMTVTNGTVSRASQSMARLTISMGEISKASEDTSKIIKTIDEIAFQTNLLALNAAVEAARAGEAGAGFAVVADEVRNLAMRAAEAAKNTASLIEGTVRKVKDGSELVGKTEKEFSEVALNVEQSSGLAGRISAASLEQARGIEQINKAVGEMDKVVQRNAANAEKSASAAGEMNARANQMKDRVEELEKLIRGANGNATGKAESASAKKPVTSPLKVPAASAKRANGHFKKGNRTAKTGPEQLIPLGDQGLSDF
ncbi:MAG: methyl-accepting chemotaxis protein [Syntrophobacteraceae bacterium]|jgi:methyl-accepting chemotaxis protein